MVSFRGWPDTALEFYRDLERENNREFWLAHKDIYERDVKAPFEALSELVAEEFGPLRVFRPNRDVRFSKDKSPYQTRCYKSVAVMHRFPPARWLGTPAAADRIVGVWRAAGPMNEWLARHVGPSTEPPPDPRA